MSASSGAESSASAPIQSTKPLTPHLPTHLIPLPHLPRSPRSRRHPLPHRGPRGNWAVSGSLEVGGRSSHLPPATHAINLTSAHRSQPQPAAAFAILQFKSLLLPRLVFRFCFHHSSWGSGLALRTGAVAVEAHLPKPEGCSRKKALRRLPLLEREPNAGLVSLTMTCLSYLLVTTCCLILLAKHTHPAKRVTCSPETFYGSIATPRLQPGTRFVLAKKSFLVPRLQHPAILQNHTDSSAELQQLQQVLHGAGKHLGRAHFPAKFDKVLCFVAVIHTGHDGRSLGKSWVIQCRDRIAAEFSESRSLDQRVCGNPLQLSMVLYLTVLYSLP